MDNILPGTDGPPTSLMDKLKAVFGLETPQATLPVLPTIHVVRPTRQQVIDDLSENGVSLLRQQTPAKVMTSYAGRHGVYKPGLSDLIYKAITPETYGPGQSNATDDGSQNRALRLQQALRGEDPGPRAMSTPQREDAWRFYLGLPQKNNTFSKSVYSPGKAKDKSAEYFKINGKWDHILSRGNIELDSGKTQGIAINDAGFDDSTQEKGTVKWIVDALNKLENKKGVTYDAEGIGDGQKVGVMGNYTLGLGQDRKGPYISYYDIWDLDMPGASRIGKPYEIYDRLYYDPKTFKIRK